MLTIAPLQPASLETAAITLERAFLSDPMFAWIIPDVAARGEALRQLNRAALEYALRNGRVMEANGARAISVWIPPGHEIGSMEVSLRLDPRQQEALKSATETMLTIHKVRVPEPHWYLMIVGVDPELQGQGVGSALVREGLARADQDGLPCYLETSEARNVVFYERLGFKVVEAATLGTGGPPAWGMRR